jgi:uncharacterized protein
MDAGKLFGRGISFPPRLSADGRMVWSEGEQNIREAIRVILMTEERERINLPDFGGGLNQYLFEPNTVMTRHLIQDRIVKALAAWEPRVRVESVDVVPDPQDAQAAVATITYQLVATQARERVSLNVTFNS